MIKTLFSATAVFFLWKFVFLQDMLKFGLVKWVACLSMFQGEKWSIENMTFQGNLLSFGVEVILLYFENLSHTFVYVYIISICIGIPLGFFFVLNTLSSANNQNVLVNKKESTQTTGTHTAKKQNLQLNESKGTRTTETVTPIEIVRVKYELMYNFQTCTLKYVPVVSRTLMFRRQLPFEEKRLLDIKKYLSASSCLRSRYLMTDEFGWLIPKLTLQSDLQIAHIKGVTLDWSREESPTVKIHYTRAENGNGLLNINDIKDMLQLDTHEIKNITFSLDEAKEVFRDDNCNPLCLNQLTTIYEKVCGVEKLANTGIMETLFYADYIMKWFAIGSEVSANFPFDVRPVSNLLKHLSKELQHALRPPHLRESQTCVCTHRMWIEFGDAKYQTHVSDLTEYYHIDSVDVGVKTESLGPCSTRNGCKSFANDMTSCFAEISNFFPIFKRLTEIAKLQFALIKVIDRLGDRGYKLTVTDSDVELPKTDSKEHNEFAPSSCNKSFTVSGGVQMAPTYNKFPTTPNVDDNVTYGHTQKYVVSPLKKLVEAGEGGIRSQPKGSRQMSDDEAALPSLLNSLPSLELAMLASIVLQKHNE